MSVDSSWNDTPCLVALGNPLLDLCVCLPDDSILREFGLADDSAKEVTAPEYESLVKAVYRYPHNTSPGGAALNTLRVFQWLWGKPYSSVFLGTIGNDETGELLSNIVQQSGVSARFIKHPTLHTGTAISFIYGNKRSLVAHLGAANVYNVEDFHEETLIHSTYMVYIENFFLAHSADVVWKVVKICKMSGVAIAFNLSGSYLFGTMDQEICTMVRYANILFGNESEFQALSRTLGWGTEQASLIAQRLSDEGVNHPQGSTKQMKPLRMKVLDISGKIVVVTRGHLPVFCASQDKQIASFETEVLSPKEGVKDTTGAGDAFVAGFFKGLYQDLTLQQCVYLGCYASAEIIQQVGCCTPNKRPLELDLIEKYFKSDKVIPSTDNKSDTCS